MIQISDSAKNYFRHLLQQQDIEGRDADRPNQRDTEQKFNGHRAAKHLGNIACDNRHLGHDPVRPAGPGGKPFPAGLRQIAAGGHAKPGAKTLRFKVDDGVIVFPVSAKGRRASAEGVFERLSGEMAKEYEADRQKSKGGDTKNAVPTFQVKATGAVIY